MRRDEAVEAAAGARRWFKRWSCDVRRAPVGRERRQRSSGRRPALGTWHGHAQARNRRSPSRRSSPVISARGFPIAISGRRAPWQLLRASFMPVHGTATLHADRALRSLAAITCHRCLGRVLSLSPMSPFAVTPSPQLSPGSAVVCNDYSVGTAVELQRSAAPSQGQPCATLETSRGPDPRAQAGWIPSPRAR